VFFPGAFAKDFRRTKNHATAIAIAIPTTAATTIPPIAPPDRPWLLPELELWTLDVEGEATLEVAVFEGLEEAEAVGEVVVEVELDVARAERSSLKIVADGDAELREEYVRFTSSTERFTTGLADVDQQIFI
jgi:hypothetical protein